MKTKNYVPNFFCFNDEGNFSEKLNGVTSTISSYPGCG